MTTGVNQASLVGPAVVTSQGNSQGGTEEEALTVVWRGAGGAGAWQAGDGGHDLSQRASF